MSKVDLAVLNKAVAEARRRVNGAQHLVNRNKSKAAIQQSVASALGVVVNQAHKRKIKRQQFIDDGSRIMRGGFHQAFTSGAQDAWDDFDYNDAEVNTYEVDRLDRLQERRDEHWAMVGGMVDDPAYMDDTMDRIDGKVSRHHGFLDGLFTAVLAITALDALSSLGSRIDLYGGSAASEYERGYAGVGKRGGRHPIWHVTSEDPCDLCDGRDGEEYASADDVDCWPTDGDFGECCDGGPNCRCYLEWTSDEIDGEGDQQSGLDNVPDVSLYAMPDLVKVHDLRVFWPTMTKSDMYKGDVPGHVFHGNQWSGGGGNVVEPILEHHLDGSQALERSRAVSNPEFQALAREGKSMLDERQSHGGPTTGLDKNWEGTKHRAWDAAQKSWGGTTIDSHTGEWVKDGENKFALTVKEPGQKTISINATHGTFDDFSKAMDRAKEEFPQLRNAGMHLGVFHNDDVDRIDIDPTLVVNTLHEVEAIGAYTHAVGGAYNFKDGLGYWPPHVAGLSKGDVAGHEFHGNRFTGGMGGMNDEVVNHFQAARSKFFDAGGLVYPYPYGDTTAMQAMMAYRSEANRLNVTGPRSSDGTKAGSDAVDDPRFKLFVAVDKANHAVGIVSYALDAETHTIHIGHLASLNVLPGTGSTLLSIAIKQAPPGYSLKSTYTDYSKGFHERIGRTLGGGLSSTWSADDVAKLIAGVQKLFKGDVTGHAFHGNRYTGGIGGGGEDVVHRVKSIDEAIERLSRGEKVELRQPREVATLVDKLGKIVNEAREKGEKPPNINLCNVSVPGTNLFCADSKGYSRVEMPQLTGKPTPGSPADKMPKDREGVVNLGPAFRQYMLDQGYRITDTNEEAQMLRASQDELNGAKVAGIANNWEIIPPARLFVSADNYVVDGHHRWAAAVANSLRDIGDGNAKLQVSRISLSITRLLEIANKYTEDMGIAHEDAAQLGKRHG